MTAVARISLRSAEFELAGEMRRPEGRPAGALPAMVVTPGWGGRKAGAASQIAQALAGLGFATLTFDLPGCGESEGPAERVFPDDQVRDIRAAAALLRAQPAIDAGRVGVLGLLNTGAAAVQAAADDPAIAAAVAFFPFGDGERWLRSLHRYWEWRALMQAIEADRAQRSTSGRSALIDADELIKRGPERVGDASAPAPDRRPSGRQVSLESAERIVSFKPERVAGRIAPRLAIVVAVEEDLMLPFEEAERLYAALGEPKALVAVPGIAHHEIYSEPTFGRVMSDVAGRLRAGMA